MATPTTVRDWIDRWESVALVDAATADRLRTDVARAAPPPREPASTVDRVLARARGGVVEALGYLGAAMTLGTAAVLFDVASWGDGAILLLMLAVAGVASAGVFQLTPVRTERARRLAGVLGAVAVAATAMALVHVFELWCPPGDCRGVLERVLPLAVSLPTVTLAGVLYLRHRHLLTHAALGGATAMTVTAVGRLLVPTAASWQTRDAVLGALFLVVAAVWIWASETGRLDPPWLGTLAAGGVTYGGVVMMTSWDPLFGTGSGDVTVLASLAVAAAHLAVGVLASRLRVTIVGALGLVVTVPWTFTEVFGWTPTQTALLLLPVGLALTGWAVVAGRDG